MIEGVAVKKLEVFPDDRGRVMEILRKDDVLFQGFGQVYMSTTFPGVVKGWHYHKNQKDHICCVSGMIKLAVFDRREDSVTKDELNVFHIGIHSPTLVKIPEGVFHGWKCISEYEACIINTVSEVFNKACPDEVRVDPHHNDIPFSWERKDG
jgi:dTDP-4-dehydrorhamnose 3,5-epimerase